MAKVMLRQDGSYLVFHCVACKCGHRVPIRGERAWGWNGDVEKPTLTPSLRVFVPAVNEPDFKSPEQTLCHVVVTDGILNYCADCPHELRGKAIPMVDMENDGRHGE